MAQEALKKLEEQLDCSICLDTYTDPKLLQCHHVYCQKCLVRLVIQDQQGQFTLTCPTCRQVTPLPANGVAGLQPAFHINHMLEIQDFLKKIRSHPEESLSKTASPRPVKTLPQCAVHLGKESELYCVKCEQLICTHCAIKGGNHHSHDYKRLDQALEAVKEEIESSLKPLESRLTAVREAMVQLEACRGEISSQQVAIEASVSDDFKRLHEVLDVRKNELTEELRKITQSKLDALSVQRDQLETTLAQLSSCVDSMRESLKTGGEGEVLMMKTTIVKQVRELTTTFQPDTLKPNTTADMVYSTSAATNSDIVALLEQYGQVLALGVLDPSRCHASGEGTHAASVGVLSTALVQMMNFQYKPCEEPVESLECRMVSELGGAEAKCIVDQLEKSQYEVSYLPAIKGRHQLHIKVEGQHIRESPFSVAVRSSVVELGTPILTLDGVEKPMGVAVNSRGEVFVTDAGADCVSVFSPRGEKLRSFGTCGSGMGAFRLPRGVAFTGDGLVLVTDGNNHRIQKFTAEGKFVTVVGTSGNGPLQFNSPGGIACNSDFTKVYVVDENHRVQVLNSDLTFSNWFGREGSGKGQFNYPSDVACDSSGNVYVVDRYNHRVQVFTTEGMFLRMFGRRGEGGDKLNFPVGIAVDIDNTVYVSDSNNHRVSVFTSEGRFVTSFGRRGKGRGEMKYPSRVAVDSSGVVYVCDWGNHRLQVF